jgi:DNA-binding NarL/FixJ family response regulator
MTMLPWRVWIVEDDERQLDHLVGVVQSSASLHVLATHATRAQALQWLAQSVQGPDALLCDLGLPDGSGLDVIRAACAAWPGCDAMVVSTFGDDTSVLASIVAGAVGYILKDASQQDVVQAIVDMKAGAAPMSPMIARGVLARLRTQAAPLVPVANRDARSAHPNTAALSEQELVVLHLIARGYSYAEIAQRQRVTMHTVQSHIKNLYRKLSVHSRGEAVFEGHRLGLIQLDGLGSGGDGALVR